MCGIVGFTGSGRASGFLLDGLARLEYRGYDSAGVAVIDGGKITSVKTTGRIKTLNEMTGSGENLFGTIGVGHTRWATHGAPTIENAHPHLSSDGRFAVVHNGIIENYAEIKAQLIAEGAEFLSETDTEVVPQLLQKYYNGDLGEAVRKTVSRLEGSYALGILCADYPETLVAVREFSPLIVGLGAGANYIASDVTALVPYTRDVLYIEDGETAFITPDGIDIRDSAGNAIGRERVRITWDIEAAEKSGYDHFMLKEIMEQPQAVRQTLEGRVKNGDVVFDGMKLDEKLMRTIKRIQIIACGSAWHAGMVGKYIFEELLRIPTDVDLASEFRYRNPVVGASTLSIVISQSGETADTLAALREAKERGSHVLSIVNVVGSSIAKASDDVLYTHAGPEIAVATTKGYSTQLVALYLFGVWAARRLGTAGEEKISALLDGIRALPEAIEGVLAGREKIRESAKHCTGEESLYFIGRNIDYAAALEASLKLKEISYIHSETYAGGEMKHGAISLIEPGRTVIALACGEALREKLLGNIREVAARGAYVTACAFEGSDLGGAADDVIYVPRVHPMLAASVEVIPFQLYAYYAAKAKGCDIDKPRNLAKSVTVE